MGLKELWESTTATSGVLSAVGKQVRDPADSFGVNYMDGGTRPTPTSADQFQTEFKRYGSGNAETPVNKSSGANHTVPTSYTPSRWTSKALKLAFDGEGPSSLSTGYYETTRFRVWKAGTTTQNIHNYIPAADYNAATTGGYINQFAFARDRKNARATSL